MLSTSVCVIGLGYIGLPTAAIAAAAGYRVTGVDINPKVLSVLERGDIHIVEPNLQTQVQHVISSGSLQLSSVPVTADIFIVCVPTPITRECVADLSFVKSAVQSLLPCIKVGSLVILESTVPPLTTEEIVAPILEAGGLRIGEDVFLAYCPERVLPGRIIEELKGNDRIVGGVDPESAERAKTFYSRFVSGQIFKTTSRVAEMAKLSENAFRDVNIAYANELAKVCCSLDIPIGEVIALANHHPRVNILNPGPGVGGHCIAVDPWFIVEKAEAPLLKTARQINDSMPYFIVDRIKKLLDQICGSEPKVVACLGVTYKADVDDIRESPALKIVQLLKKEPLEVRICDPFVPTIEDVQTISLEEAITGADCLVLLVDHRIFRMTSLVDMQAKMRHPFFVDTRGIWDQRNKLDCEQVMTPLGISERVG